MFWPFNHYPGSDYETFNYDWIIGKLKELKDSVAAALASEQAAAESAEKARVNMVAATMQATKAERAATNAAHSAEDAADSAESIADARNQINSNTSRIDGLIANAGDGTIPSELSDIRIGYNGQPYATAGAAVRGQAETNADQLDRVVDELTMLNLVEWEHGGIDNATGEDNNPGSLSRSRTKTGDFYESDAMYIVTNNTNAVAWIIVYNQDGSFRQSLQVPANQTYDLKNYGGLKFRIDYRGALEDTSSILVYKGDDEVLVTDVKKHDEILTSYRTTPSFTWEMGTVGDSDGSLNESTTRIRTQLFTVPAGAVLHVKCSAKGWIQTYRYISGAYAGYTAAAKETTLKVDRQSTFRIVYRYGSALPITTAASSDVTAGIYEIGAGITETNAIPSYWSDAISAAETRINNSLASDEKSVAFGFVTDTHIGNNAGHSGAILQKVMEDCHIPAWFHGGDAVTGYGIISKQGIIDQMNADFLQFKNIEHLGLRAIGNHDPAFGINNNYDCNLKNSEINQYYHGADREKFLQVYGDERGYFYKDLPQYRLRCVVLDIIAYESQVDADDFVTGANKMFYHQFGNKQLNWLAKTLKSTPEGYSVVICSHIAPVSLAELQNIDNTWSESTPIDYYQARKIAQAYRNKTVYTFNGAVAGDQTNETYNISADFRNAKGTFVCYFCGHTHKDFNLTLNDILIVGTANDSLAVSANASSHAPAKTAGTNTEHIIDFFCIKPSTRILDVIRLGASLPEYGVVRTLTY